MRDWRDNQRTVALKADEPASIVAEGRLWRFLFRSLKGGLQPLWWFSAMETLRNPLFQQLLESGRPRATGRLDMRGLSETTQLPMVVGGTKGKIRADSATSDETLIRRLQAHDEIAFADIVERYQAKVFSIIYGILRNHNDVEDIAQQVFSKTYFAIRSFDSRGSLLTWIYRITVNECYEYLRKRRARRIVYESDFSAEEAQWLETAKSVVDPAARVDRQLLERDLVVTLLSKIPEQARTLMLLREVEGHSMEELAAMTGLKENTIKVTLFRTRQKLLQAARRLGKCEMIRSNSGHTKRENSVEKAFHGTPGSKWSRTLTGKPRSTSGRSPWPN
jgi:RNA polymerase sigma-70 factor (ECF subfamily)